MNKKRQCNFISHYLITIEKKKKRTNSSIDSYLVGLKFDEILWIRIDILSHRSIPIDRHRSSFSIVEQSYANHRHNRIYRSDEQ
jgi:hypothetical protein